MRSAIASIIIACLMAFGIKSSIVAVNEVAEAAQKHDHEKQFDVQYTTRENRMAQTPKRER